MKLKLTILSMFFTTLMMSQSTSFNPFIKNHKPLNQRYSDLSLKIENRSAYLKYDYLKSTKKNQFRLDVDVEPAPGLTRILTDARVTNPWKHSNLNVKFGNQYYLGKKMFINTEAGYAGMSGYSGGYKNHFVNGKVGIGYGRIYQIDRATSIGFIVEKLKKEGLLEEDLSTEEFEVLVSILEKGKSVKELTNRAGQSKIYFGLMEYLKPKLSKDIGEDEFYHIIQKSMKSDHLSLTRQKGFKIGVNYLRSGGFLKIINFGYEARVKGVELTLDYHKPLGLKWQMDHSLTVDRRTLDLTNLNTDREVPTYFTERTTNNLTYELGFTNYLRNRTSAYGKGIINYSSQGYNLGLELGMNIAVSKNMILNPFIQVNTGKLNNAAYNLGSNMRVGLGITF